MLVFVFLNQDPENVHERSERMIFIFANFVGNTIEQIHELPVIRFGCERRGQRAILVAKPLSLFSPDSVSWRSPFANMETDLSLWRSWRKH